MSEYEYDGGPLGSGAPKPDNFDAMVEAARTRNRPLFRAEVAIYESQLRAEGYHDRWTDSGRVLPPGW